MTSNPVKLNEIEVNLKNSADKENKNSFNRRKSRSAFARLADQEKGIT